MNKLKVLELFGGIGACSKALEKLGIEYEIADYVEIDKYAVKSFNAMHNTNFEPQDITKWDKDIEVDLVMHGSPCQDFSLAGLQAGGDEGSGTRSSLMYETLRIVKKLKPKYVIWENVKNLLSKKHRHNFDSYLEIMESLGYKNYYQVLNAKDYGIPQNRERVFTVSIRNDYVLSGTYWYAIDDNDYEPYFKFPPKQELKLKLKDMLEDSVDEKYYLSDKAIIYALDLNDVQVGTKWEGSTSNGSVNKNVAMTIGCRSASCQRAGITNYVLDDYDEEVTVKTLKEQLCNELIKENKVKENDVIRHSYSTSRMKEWKTRNIEKNNEVPTLDTRCDCLGVAVKNNTKQGYLMAYPGDGVYTNTSTKRGTVQKDMIQTLTTFQDKGVILPDLRIRKLTPKECWRLMGFDDEDYEKASKVCSNAQLYKQAGNSIVVNVLMAIFNKLLKKGE